MQKPHAVRARHISLLLHAGFSIVVHSNATKGMPIVVPRLPGVVTLIEPVPVGLPIVFPVVVLTLFETRRELFEFGFSCRAVDARLPIEKRSDNRGFFFSES